MSNPMENQKLSRRRFVQGGLVLAASGYVRADVKADVVLFNGDIHTVDSLNSHVQALAIAGNRVIGVGSSVDMQSLIGPSTQAIDLAGRTVLPGINDSHLHLMGWGMSRPPFALDLTYPQVKSIADCVHEVQAAVGKLQAGEWVVGRGWDQAYLAEARPPVAGDLDLVSRNNPVVLTDFSGHAVWANSLALTLGGIGPESVAPPGGVIVADDNGQPTGLLFEGAAWMLKDKVPEPSIQTRRAAIEAAMSAMLARGVTSCTEPGLSPEILGLYNRIAGSDLKAKMRVTGLVMAGSSMDSLRTALQGQGVMSSTNPAFMQLPGVKIMGDGIPTGNETAWLHEPYESGGNGSLLIDGATHSERVAELQGMIELCHAAGLQVGTHVTGDRSIDTVVDAYADCQATDKQANARHYLIHADLVSPATLEKMAKHNIGANFNPEIKHLIADSQVFSLGVKRAAYEWPYRSALDAGVTVASSSDAPVTPANWLQGLATCVDRRGKQSGQVSGPAQRITLDEAIRTYTLAGAWQDKADHMKGSLEVGKVADLCVLDERLASIESDRYTSAKVMYTYVDGQLVYSATT